MYLFIISFSPFYFKIVATNFSNRFVWGLGMKLVAKSDMSTGNNTYCSHVIASHDIKYIYIYIISFLFHIHHKKKNIF